MVCVIKPIGFIICEAREDLEMTQSELASTLQVSQPYVSKIESGAKEPGIEFLQRVNAALGNVPGIQEQIGMLKMRAARWRRMLGE